LKSPSEGVKKEKKGGGKRSTKSKNVSIKAAAQGIGKKGHPAEREMRIGKEEKSLNYRGEKKEKPRAEGPLQ